MVSQPAKRGATLPPWKKKKRRTAKTPVTPCAVPGGDGVKTDP
jgi:hypothetical protein